MQTSAGCSWVVLAILMVADILNAPLKHLYVFCLYPQQALPDV